LPASRPAPSPAPQPTAASRAARIWRRTRVGGILTVLLFGLLLGTSFVPSSLPVLAIGAALSVLLALEFNLMGSFREWRAGAALVAASAAATLVLLLAPPGGPMLLYAQALAAAACVAALLRAAPPMRRARRPVAIALLALWLLVPLPAMALVRESFGHGGLVALLVLSKVGDIAGFYGGSLFGRHHPFPRISPGKTTEGCLASVVVGVAAGAVFAATDVLAGAWWQGMLAGLAINLAAQAGDLFESHIKRRAGVKDSGPWFGPSGGLLDLADSLLFSVPAALFLWPLILPA